MRDTTIPQARRHSYVLLADDDAEMRAVLTERLRRIGCSVLEARDGNHLMRLVDELVLFRATKARLIDLIISDVRMPGRSGLEVLAALRNHDRETPVVLITAFGDEATHAEGRRLGAYAVFDKPFDLDDLCTAVLNLPDGSGLA